MVFIHFQLIRSPYQSSPLYGEDFLSSSSLYTGIMTRENLTDAISASLLTLIQEHSRGVREHWAFFV